MLKSRGCFERVLSIGVVLVALAHCSLARGDLPPPPSGIETSTIDGIEFSTIGHPGNRTTNYAERDGYSYIWGSVANQYRISRTEITASQYLPFIQAYAAVNPSILNGPFYTSLFIGPSPSGQLQLGDPSFANYAVDVGLLAAMRYCNWLHNGRNGSAASFESGAYTITPIGYIPGQGYSDTITRSADARYWIPSVDEWVKAVYFDPNRYGTGVEGYWKFPYGSDEPPIPGIDTNGQLSLLYLSPVATYDHAQTPSGLFDASGGWAEWTDTRYHQFSSDINRFVLGSGIGGVVSIDDYLGTIGYLGGDFSGPNGFRIVTTVPGPSSVLLLGLAASFTRRKVRIYE